MAISGNAILVRRMRILVPGVVSCQSIQRDKVLDMCNAQKTVGGGLCSPSVTKSDMLLLYNEIHLDRGVHGSMIHRSTSK